jgi:hypothetical protein
VLLAPGAPRNGNATGIAEIGFLQFFKLISVFLLRVALKFKK